MRRPSEKMSIGRIFRLKEGVTLNIRADFNNVFNRLLLAAVAPSPILRSTSAAATRTYTSSGMTSAGFGDIPTDSLTGARSGIIVARIQF